MTIEQWKDIAGYNGIYQVSNTGKIKSLARSRSKGVGKLKEKIMKTTPGKRGYPLVRLEKNGMPRTFFVHRLVAITFLGEQSNMEVHHKNYDRMDARLENLQWVTPHNNYNAMLLNNNLGKYSARKHPPEYMI